MKRTPLCLAMLIAVVPFAFTANSSEIRVYFSPHGGCTEAVVEALEKARLMSRSS